MRGTRKSVWRCGTRRRASTCRGSTWSVALLAHVAILALLLTASAAQAASVIHVTTTVQSVNDDAECSLRCLSGRHA
jgi:hypothetical protein